MSTFNTILIIGGIGLIAYFLWRLSQEKGIPGVTCPQGWKPFYTDIGLECMPPKGTMGKACTDTLPDGKCRPGETLELDPRGYRQFDKCCKQIRLA